MTLLVDGQKGDFNTMKFNTEDSLGVPLVWTFMTEDNGFVKEEFWIAKGTDGKTYKIVFDIPPTTPEGRVNIIG